MNIKFSTATSKVAKFVLEVVVFATLAYAFLVVMFSM